MNFLSLGTKGLFVFTLLFGAIAFGKAIPVYWYSIGVDFSKNNWYTGSSPLDEKQIQKALQNNAAIRLENLRARKSDHSPWEKSANEFRQGTVLLGTKHIIVISLLSGDPMTTNSVPSSSEGTGAGVEPKSSDTSITVPGETAPQP